MPIRFILYSAGRNYSRLTYWHLAPGIGSVPVVIRESGANSIFVGRTPHELYDELCRAFTS